MLSYYFVAFVDILGFAEMVSGDCQSGNDENKFYPALHEALRATAISLGTLDGATIKQFSDSIIVSLPYNTSKNVFADLVFQIATLQRRLFGKGVLTRGGVAHGKHFEESDFVFSQAVVSAYRIESSLAVFPRVVVSSDLIQLFGVENMPYCQDRDGQIFLDYLDGEDERVVIERIEDAGRSAAHPRVAEKVRWLGDYASIKHPLVAERLSSKILVMQ